jgi:hypothetical protein
VAIDASKFADIRSLSAVSLATVGLVNWALQEYYFHGQVPYPVATAVYVILPALIGYFTTHVALNMSSPKELAVFRKNFQDAVKRNNITILPKAEKTMNLDVPPGPGGSLTWTRDKDGSVRVTSDGKNTPPVADVNQTISPGGMQ